MRWLPLALLVLLHACGSSSAPGGGGAFDRFWDDFDRTYSYFEHKQVDWSADRAGLRQRAAATSGVPDLVAVLRDAVVPLRDGHVWFRPPSGPVQPTWSPTRAPNWDQTLWAAALPGLGWHQGNDWGWGRAGDVGYMAIGSWTPAQISIGDLDAALDQPRDTRILVIDVRMNGGGDDSLALQLAGRFASQTIRFGATRVRNGRWRPADRSR